jgi:hypothetical protein
MPRLKKEQWQTNEGENQYPTGFRLVMALLYLSLGTFLMALDCTIISVATPRISRCWLVWFCIWHDTVLSSFYKHFNHKIVFLVVVVIFERMWFPVISSQT